jgi:hypothetical protein
MFYIPLNLQDSVKLLTGGREERFLFERAIRLFEFQTWIYWPGTDKSYFAGMMASALILEAIEDDIFYSESAAIQSEADPGGRFNFDPTDKPDATLSRINVLRNDRRYRQLHDYIFAARGGLTNLLYCLTPEEFDGKVLKRRENVKIVADLIDYRLRHAQHGGTAGHGNISHAVFFKWWPTHDVSGKRGVTLPNKSPWPKTLFKWWRDHQCSAIFIYLNERHQYSQIPHIENVAVDGAKLQPAASDADELRRFFGAYAYIAEAIHSHGGEPPFVLVPATLPRVEIHTPPFNPTELQTIADYAENYTRMNG